MKGQSLGGHILIPEPMLLSAPVILPSLQCDRPLIHLTGVGAAEQGCAGSAAV